MLAAWLTQNVSPENLTTIAVKQLTLSTPLRMAAEIRLRWEELLLPLPSARLKLEPGAEWAGVVQEVLCAENLTLPELRVKGMHKPFFSKGDRPACVRPVGLEATAGPDERHPGRMKMVLRFDLPRGSYATMLVKRITATGA